MISQNIFYPKCACPTAGQRITLALVCRYISFQPVSRERYCTYADTMHSYSQSHCRMILSACASY